MRLTRFTDYSLRVLIYLGLRPGEWVTIRQISDAHGISRNHLMKVVSHLAQKGYLDSQRGPGGGVRLERPPLQISLADVVVDSEVDLQLAECFGPNSECVLTPACALRPVLADALQAFLATLGRYSLADLLEPRPRLATQLGISIGRR